VAECPYLAPDSHWCWCRACERLFSSPTGFAKHQRQGNPGTICMQPWIVDLVADQRKDGVVYWRFMGSEERQYARAKKSQLPASDL
jgi:hypothetical protein